LNNNRNTGEGYEKKITESNTVPCHSRKIPLWLVLLDNIPTLLLFLLGFLIIYKVSLAGTIVFETYALFSIVWLWPKPFMNAESLLRSPKNIMLYLKWETRVMPAKEHAFCMARLVGLWYRCNG